MTPEQREALNLLAKLADFMAAKVPTDPADVLTSGALRMFADRMDMEPDEMRVRLHWAADLAGQVAEEAGR